MLKLEKIAKSRELSVMLRAKSGLLSTSFLLALAYAIFIHLAAFIIFPISPFKFSYQESLFPPVIVASDAPAYIAYTDPSFNYEIPIPNYLISPKVLVPEFPSIQEKPLEKKIEYIQQKSPLNNPFLGLEEHLEMVDVNDPLSERTEHALVVLRTSGAIAELSLEHYNPFEEELRTLDTKFKESIMREYPKGFHRYFYTVNIDKRNGELFWWEFTREEGSPKLQAHSLKVLKSIKFFPLSALGVEIGEVEIMINVNFE